MSDPPDREHLEVALQRLLTEIVDFYSNVETLPVLRKPDRRALRRDIQSCLEEPGGTDLRDLLERVIPWMREGLVQVTHPRYFGHFNPSVHPASIVADALAALYNPQLAVHAHARAASEVEAAAIVEIATRFGFPAETVGGHFTSGGSEANHTAVVVALNESCRGFSTGGVRSLPGDPVIYASCDAHDSLHKLARACGLGTNAVGRVAVDGSRRMQPAALVEAIAKDRERGRFPVLVIATAGTTTCGAIDPLRELAEVAGREQLWLHVDAAYGGAAVLSPTMRPVLEGIQLADSVTFDPHKWLSVPMGAGLFLCKDRRALTRAFSIETPDYMPRGDPGVADPYRSSLQWSRRFIGLKVFFTLGVHGRTGIARMVDDMCEQGERLRELLTERGFEILNDSPLPVICFTHPRIRGNPAATRRLVRSVWKRGQAWISEVMLADASVLRAAITSFRTTDRDLRILLDELDTVLEEPR